MELDDLKHSWQQQPAKIKHTDIMELIRHKSYGPIAALKRSFKKEMKFLIIIPVFVLMVNVKDWEKTLSSVMFWSYIIFCFGVFSFSYQGYRIVGKMEGMEGMVKGNLQKQITLLEKRLQRTITGVRIALLYFIALTEVLPYFQHYRMLDKWHALSPWIRFSTYAGLLLLQYFVSRYALHRKFGQHLTYLKGLVRELQ